MENTIILIQMHWVLVFSAMLYSNLHCKCFLHFLLPLLQIMWRLVHCLFSPFSCFLYCSHTFSSPFLLFFLPTTFLFKLRLLKFFLETPKLSRNWGHKYAMVAKLSMGMNAGLGLWEPTSPGLREIRKEARRKWVGLCLLPVVCQLGLGGDWLDLDLLCFLAQVGVGLEGGTWRKSPGHSDYCLRQEKEAARIAEQ